MTTRPQSGPKKAAQDVANLGLVRPPLVYLISLVTGAVGQLASPLPFLPGTLAVPLGAALVAVAITLFSYSVAKFRAAGTPVLARARRARRAQRPPWTSGDAMRSASSPGYEGVAVPDPTVSSL